MKKSARIQLVNSAVLSGAIVMNKAASATPAQTEILEAAWPKAGENIEKRAALSRIIAAGAMVEEAEASLQGQAA